jgi:hypothetical protein
MATGTTQILMDTSRQLLSHFRAGGTHTMPHTYRLCLKKRKEQHG